MTVDYDAPGRKSGIGGLFQRLRCGGRLGVTRGHSDTEWVDGTRDRWLRCNECGQVLDVEPLWMKEYDSLKRASGETE